MLSWTVMRKRLIRKPVKKRNTAYLAHKEEARSLIVSRLAHYSQAGVFTYKRVAIRDQKRCWGSCSSKSNLNFSYKLLFLPPCYRDYIIVHELCHLTVLNHSVDFWNEVAKILPDYKERMTKLRIMEKTCGTSLKALAHYRMDHTCTTCVQTATQID